MNGFHSSAANWPCSFSFRTTRTITPASTTAETAVMTLLRSRVFGPGTSKRTVACLVIGVLRSVSPAQGEGRRLSSGHRHPLGQPAEEEPGRQGQHQIAQCEPEEDR